MWDTILNNLPLYITFLVATIVCGADLIKAISVWRTESKKKKEQEYEQRDKAREADEALGLILSRLDGLDEKIDTLNTRLDSSEKKLQDLTTSDMHNIKSWIVEQYHKFYINQEWIDAYNADTINRRYEDYKKEGGNSYIDTLIERIHSLPMDSQGTNKS